MRKQLILLCCLFAAASSQAAPAVTDRTPTAKPAAVANAVGYAAKTERGRLAQQIVRKWAGYVQKVYGTAPMDWSRAMNDTFAQADIANLRAAAKFQTYEAMVGRLLGQKTSDDSVITALAKDSSKANILALGSPASDLVYTMLNNPCRIVDTRKVIGGTLKAGTVKNFQGSAADFNNQGGSAANCGIPINPSALVLNATVVNPVGPGHLRLFPFNPDNGPIPEAASLNYVKGQTVSNEVIVKQTVGQSFDFSAFSVAGTELVIDVAGYFMAPVATAVECETRLEFVALAADFNGVQTSSIQCRSGFRPVSAHCSNGNQDVISSGGSGFMPENGQEKSFCQWHNYANAPLSVTQGVRCCQVPGR